jgi:single-stranded-DNA-specific exonuclease
MEMVNPDDTVIVVARKNWHEGVVGIVASRLVDKFGKPALVLAINDGIAKGSARSIGDVNLHELLVLSDTHLLKYGGHKMAAGLALNENDLDAFRAEINSHAAKLDKSLFIPKDQIMGELYAPDIDFRLLNMIEQFEPYGEGNLRPKFLMKNVTANYVKRMGADKMTLGFSVDSPHEKYGLKAVAFRNNDELGSGQKLSFSYTLNKNEYKERISIQLMLDKLYL